VTRLIPRALLTERRCAECHAIFARMPDEPDRPYNPARCGFCLARLDVETKPVAA